MKPTKKDLKLAHLFFNEIADTLAVMSLAQLLADRTEECAKVADERARIMNVLGCDANMKRTMTHAEIQSERVLEAQEIATSIRKVSGE